MYDFLLDIADQDTIQPAPVIAPVGDRSHLDVYMTRYQRQRQRVYDRARHLVDGRNHSRVEVRDAKAEAGLVGSEARISREQGAQLMWIRSLLQNHGAARYGYSSPLTSSSPKPTCTARPRGIWCIWRGGSTTGR